MRNIKLFICISLISILLSGCSISKVDNMSIGKKIVSTLNTIGDSDTIKFHQKLSIKTNTNNEKVEYISNEKHTDIKSENLTYIQKEEKYTIEAINEKDNSNSSINNFKDIETQNRTNNTITTKTATGSTQLYSSYSKEDNSITQYLYDNINKTWYTNTINDAFIEDEENIFSISNTNTVTNNNVFDNSNTLNFDINTNNDKNNFQEIINNLKIDSRIYSISDFYKFFISSNLKLSKEVIKIGNNSYYEALTRTTFKKIKDWDDFNLLEKDELDKKLENNNVYISYLFDKKTKKLKKINLSVDCSKIKEIDELIIDIDNISYSSNEAIIIPNEAFNTTNSFDNYKIVFDENKEVEASKKTSEALSWKNNYSNIYVDTADVIIGSTKLSNLIKKSSFKVDEQFEEHKISPGNTDFIYGTINGMTGQDTIILSLLNNNNKSEKISNCIIVGVDIILDKSSSNKLNIKYQDVFISHSEDSIKDLETILEKPTYYDKIDNNVVKVWETPNYSHSITIGSDGENKLIELIISNYEKR